MKFWKNLVSAILGGISISLGTAAYLAVKQESILAACLLFSMGFLAVAIFEFGLFTDKAGFLFEKGNTENNIKRLLVALTGNIIGSLVAGIALISKVNIPAKEVFTENYYGLDFGFFLSSILAGALIYIAMHGYRKADGKFASCAILILATAIIPACGLEYVISNTFSIGAALTNANQYTSYFFQIACIEILSAFGNAIGAVAFASLYRLKNASDDHRHGHRHHKHRHESAKDSTESSEKTGI